MPTLPKASLAAVQSAARAGATVIELAIPRRPHQQEAGGIEYKFEELGLEVERGFTAGMFNGTAEINWFCEDGETQWFVDDILLDCTKWNGTTHEHEQIKLEKHTVLYHLIWTELTDGSFKDSIQAKLEASA